MGLQPARGSVYRESAGKFGRSTHDGLMRRGESLDYLRKGIDPMATRVEGRGKEVRRQGEEGASGGRLCVRNKDGLAE